MKRQYRKHSNDEKYNKQKRYFDDNRESILAKKQHKRKLIKEQKEKYIIANLSPVEIEKRKYIQLRRQEYYKKNKDRIRERYLTKVLNSEKGTK